MVSQLFAGNKSELIKLLKQKDKEFLIKYLKDILPLQQWLVKSKMSQSVLTSEDDGLSVVSILACLACVNSTFSNDIAIKNEWNDWARLYLPATDSAEDYVLQLRQNGVGYHIPLKVILLDATLVIQCPAWRDKPLQSFPISNLKCFQRLCIR